ncbi:MAG: alpha/beta fold hydrolase [Verrucomicrobiales bacterium]|nr:alpha/beta fold hydrolase [Verrucomicrobiales bacterium]MCP5556827.1 alpha/beta fold hydrolase [Verrucomicrobiaceae bacterium]
MSVASFTRWLLAVIVLPLVLCQCATTGGVPKGARLDAEQWTSYDGKVMPWTRWAPPEGTKIRGVVIAVHGLSGAKSDFWFLGDQLAPAGYAVYAYDLRGQGNDSVESERGDIKSARLWERDLTTFHALVRARHPKVPIYWYGESLGSLITLHTAGQRHLPRWGPDAIILASPAAGLRVTLSGSKRWLLEAAAALSPRTRYSLGELGGIDESKIQVTNTTTHAGQMNVTPHYLSSFSLRLLAEVGYMMDANPKIAHRVRVPTLFLATPKDVLSSPDQVQTLFGQMRAQKKRLLWYTRSFHLLLHDVQREEVTRDVVNWLRKQETTRH